MALLDRFQKQPSDNLKYHIDYSDWLPVGVTLNGAVVTSIDTLNPASTDVGEPTLSVSSPVVVDSEKFQYFASGGTSGKLYKVTFQATMSDSQVLESEIEFKVNDV
jgi:hypothetical protein